MSTESAETAESDVLPDFPRPMPRASLRERLEAWAESLDLSLPRLAAGVVVLAVLGIVGWRLLAPPSTPAEMTLPMVSVTEGVGSGAGSSAETERTATNASPADSVAGEAGGQSGSSGSAGGTQPAEVVVHVAGAVREPGVQRLENGDRIVDAVEAAGGATGDADLARVNLAAKLEDGQQVYIPKVGEDPPQPLTLPGGSTAGAGSSPGGSASGASMGLVNINTAGTAELETLHGIGPALAQAIVDHREEQGPFASVEQLTDVRGIGETKLEGLRDQVTV